jgi:heme/copper-type cytochrome/quinol oxidase subunit 2
MASQNKPRDSVLLPLSEIARTIKEKQIAYCASLEAKLPATRTSLALARAYLIFEPVETIDFETLNTTQKVAVNILGPDDIFLSYERMRHTNLGSYDGQYFPYEEYFDSYFDRQKNLFGTTQGVDHTLIVPTHCFIRFLITGYKVIHSFYIPALGFKADGVPGRLLQVFA